MINEVRIVSIPSGNYLSHEQMERAQRGEPFAIDHGPTTKQPAPAEAPIVQEIEPQTPEDQRLMEELNRLSYRELLERAEKAGLVGVGSS
jgi:hypothetical protein